MCLKEEEEGVIVTVIGGRGDIDVEEKGKDQEEKLTRAEFPKVVINLEGEEEGGEETEIEYV